jgi:translocator protein
MKANYQKLSVSFGLPQLAGIIGSFFTASSIPTWYATINKPSFVPPNSVFGPVWVILFFMMGIALYLVWMRGLENRAVKKAMRIFFIQLALNTAWSIIFFGIKNPGLALLEIIVLWVAIAWTIIEFYKISRPAGLLLVPYILWVSFATALTYSIWSLN